MTDWSALRVCPQCFALMGDPCLDLFGAGPEALPSRPRIVPHSGRKLRGATSQPKSPAASTAGSQPAARRSAKTNDRLAAAWRAKGRKS